MSLPTFQIVPTVTNAAAPFCLGHTFKQGEVPAGSSVVAPFSDFQCTPKNIWPDGSLRFAILAGHASVTGTTPLVSQLSIGAAATGTPIAASSISAVATIDCGAFGAVTWSGTDWATPFETWVSGPKMSWFRYRKQVGTDAHLVAWLEVRLWSSSAVEVLPWIENGYFRVAAPTNKSATYAFTLGGTQRFSAAIDLKHHQRLALLDGVTLAHWLGTEPGVTALPDPIYMQATEMLPSYSAVVAQGAARVAAQAATLTPLQQGNFEYNQNGVNDSMPNPGYATPIGVLPEHDMLYLVCNAADRVALYKSIQRNGYSAGRYGIHYRDETTQRPPAFSAYPTLVIYDDDHIKNTGSSTTNTFTPATSGGNPPTWDLAHCPSVGYMAYLLTGCPYFKEEAQFAATANHFSVTDWVRGGGAGNDYNPYPGFTGASGIWNSGTQTRGGAWGFRTLTQALAITPDSGDTLRAELVASVEDNCRYFHLLYVAQPNHPWGFIKSGEVYTDVVGSTDHQMVPPWQHDFGTAAWGAAMLMGLPISSTAKTKMAAFFDWKAKSIVSRLGPSGSAWPFENGAPYRYGASPSLTPDYDTGVGPWYGTLALAYAGTYVSGQPPDSSTTNLLGFSDAAPERSMWGQVTAALAYAVRHGVSGAVAAQSRVQGASNYSTLTTNFNSFPVWSLKPSGQTQSGGGTLTTPGPSFIWDSAPLIANSFIWDTYRGLGIPLSAVPSGGTNGTSVIRALIESGDNPNSEARVRYISTPTGFLSGGDTSYTSPAGAINYEAYLDGASLGQATDTVGTGGGADTSAPTMNGSITPSAITSSGFTLSWPAASDDVAVTGYEVSVDSGSNYVNVGNVLTTNKSGLAASTAYPTRVRAYDAANNKSSPLSATVTTTATLPGIPGQKTFTIALGTGPTSAAANLTGLSVAFYDEQYPHQATTAKYQTGTGSTNSLGVLSFTCQSSLASGQQGHVTIYGAAGMHYNGMITAA